MKLILIVVASFISGIIVRGITDKVMPFSGVKKLLRAVRKINLDESKVDLSGLYNLKVSGKCARVLLEKYIMFADAMTDRVEQVNEVKEKGMIDNLSGCYNRNYLELRKGIYYESECVFVLFVDVNNLKKMNDTYGHDAGDALIRSCAGALRFWRKYGDVYRVGGDEFVVVVVDKPFNWCEKKVKEWYSGVGVLNRADDDFECRLAYGYSFGGTNSDFSQLESEADERMYKHKKEIKSMCGDECR